MHVSIILLQISSTPSYHIAMYAGIVLGTHDHYNRKELATLVPHLLFQKLFKNLDLHLLVPVQHKICSKLY